MRRTWGFVEPHVGRMLERSTRLRQMALCVVLGLVVLFALVT